MFEIWVKNENIETLWGRTDNADDIVWLKEFLEDSLANLDKPYIVTIKEA